VEFIVHKSRVCDKSPYFVAASSETWQKDREEGVVRLHEVDATSFELYFHWIYWDTIDLDIVDAKDECERCDEPGHSNRCQRRNALGLLIDLYLAGDFLGDVGLQNCTIDKFLHYVHRANHADAWLLTPTQIDTIWKRTSETSTLRKCVLDCVIVRTVNLGNEGERWNSQFLLDLCNRQLDALRNNDRLIFARQKCFYHDHSDGQVCPL
jgi:hypothetical protein